MSLVNIEYAFDENCNPLHITDVDKEINKEFYLYQDKSVRLIPRQGEVNQWHFAKHPKDFDRINESPEHRNEKIKIIRDGFIVFDNYKIMIKNAKEEQILENSRYRADIKCQLLCGKECIIEVIKTSDISEKKQEFIEHQNILTFKIYINEGSTIDRRIEIFGNSEIQSIRNKISRITKQINSLIYANGNFKRITDKVRL
jgi:hypothetical protein